MTETTTTGAALDDAVHRHRALSVTGLQERLFSRLFRGLVYPQIWEDPVVDMEALRLGPGSRVVCIASGGCNMMSYLTASPASVTAVDLSPAHVALGRLKLAAARHLPGHAEFHAFFAHADSPENVRRFDEILAPRLDPATRAYWTARRGIAGRRIDLFRRGFYRHGVLGRFIGAMHLLARLGGVDMRELLACRDLAEQRAFFERRLAPLFELRLVRWLGDRPEALFGLGIPPQQHEKLAADGAGAVLPVMRERLRRLVCDFPISESYFAWQVAARGYARDGAGPLPPYLEARHFEALRAAAPRGRVVNRSLTQFLADEPAMSRDGFALLDAQDWMTEAQLDALWTQITRTAAPGARVVFRTGGADDILPGRLDPRLLARWRPERELAAGLWRRDRSAIYGGLHVYGFEG